MIPVSDIARARSRIAGFTLIEVLVALSIVSLGLSGILLTINGMAASSSYLRDKTLANWVAQNHITELRLAATWPDLGKSTDDAEMAGQRWRLETEVIATPVEKLRRINVAVAYQETPDEPLVVVAAFVGEAATPSPQSDWRSGVPAAPVGGPNAPGGPNTGGNSPQTPGTPAPGGQPGDDEGGP